MRKLAKKKIRKVEKNIRNLPATPRTLTYVKMYQTLEELHFQGDYVLVCGLCDAFLNK